MTNGLNGNQVKWLTYLIYVLLTVLTTVSAGAWVKISMVESAMPDRYVMLERYKEDQRRSACNADRIEAHVVRIESKIDTLIQQGRQ